MVRTDGNGHKSRETVGLGTYWGREAEVHQQRVKRYRDSGKVLIVIGKPNGG